MTGLIDTLFNRHGRNTSRDALRIVRRSKGRIEKCAHEVADAHGIPYQFIVFGAVEADPRYAVVFLEIAIPDHLIPHANYCTKEDVVMVVAPDGEVEFGPAAKLVAAQSATTTAAARGRKAKAGSKSRKGAPKRARGGRLAG